MSRSRTLPRTGALTVGLTVGVVTLTASAASAHVTVTPDEAPAGGYATLSFQVPNESPDAATTKVAVDLPTDTPFTSVSVEPVPGWTAKVATTDLPRPVTVHGTEVTEAPTRVVWTADDDAAAIEPGEFLRFTVSAGAVPEDVDSLVLPATQTYSDGEVVAWDEPATGGAEPEHPAPTLAVAPAAQGGHEHGAGAQAAGEETTGESTTTGSSDTVPLGLGAAGLGLGLVGAVTGVVALARTRRADR